MGVLDQLVYFGSLYGEPPDRARREAHGLAAPVPDRRLRADRRAEELSKGNQQKVQFIAAVLHDPEVLLMDEPFTGLDPVNLILLREAFIELRDRGRTLVFSTHQMEAAEALCESVAIVDHGRLVAGGTVARPQAGQRRGGRCGSRSTAGRRRPGWPSCPGSPRCGPDANGAELELTPAADSSAILAAIVGRGVAVSRFEVVEPSLEALFIEHVGRPSDDDTTSSPRSRRPSAGRLARRPDGAAATRSSRTPGSSPGASTATGRAAGCSSARRSCSRSWRCMVAIAPIAVRCMDRQTVTRIAIVASDAELGQRAVSVADSLLNNVPPGGRRRDLEEAVPGRAARTARPLPRG